MAQIKFSPHLKLIWRGLKPDAWKRCIPKTTEFQDYLDRFSALQEPPIDYERWEAAAECTYTRYFAHKTNSVMPLRGRDVRAYVRSLDTSAGLSFDGEGFSRVFRFKSDIPSKAIDREIKRWMGQGFIDVPTKVAFRRHLTSGGKHKVRTIFVTPGVVSFAESFFSIPITRMFKTLGHSHPIGTGFSWLEGDARTLFAQFPLGNVASADFSSFDISARAQQVRKVFDLIRRLLQLNEWEEKLFNMLADYQTSTLVSSNQRLVRMTGGVRSGSSFTHILGSILNMTLVVAGSGQSRDLNFKVFGDDLVLSLTDALHWQDFVDGCKACGFEISVDKSVLGAIHWLGFDVSTGAPKLLSPDKWWAGFLHPERPDDTMAHHKARLAGYILSSMGDERFLRDAFKVWDELAGVKLASDCGMVNYFIKEVFAEAAELDDIKRNCRRLWRRIC
jgi:hypothetical protein